MSLDGTFNPAALYVEQLNTQEFDPVIDNGYRVQQDGKTLYSHLSPLPVFTFGHRTAAGNFTEVSVNGQLVYKEDATRSPIGS